MRKLFLILMTLVCTVWSLQAQTRTYHGTVVDAANGDPLIGATIMPVGGGQGAAADIDGNFAVTVPVNVKKATVSYVGYASQTVELHENMMVRLSSTDTSLDDLVVVAYGSATKQSLTGSVAVVDSKQIEDRPVTSVTAALEGNAPGVMVNNSVGSPGSAPTVVIRGFNTINGSSTPLYVVDGVPYNGAIADLNPADIESMSVLKDAASCALYGNRGANGVILITTKKAKNAGKVDVQLQIRQGMYNRGLPFYDRLNPVDWMQTSFDALVNGSMSRNEFDTREEAINNWRTGFISQYTKFNPFGGTTEDGEQIGYSNAQLFNYYGKFQPNSVLSGYKDDLDWWDAVSRSGYRQEYNVNAAAATDKFNIFASVGYLKENGYMLQTDFERFSARLNANFQPTSYLSFGVNLYGATQNSETGSGTEGSNLASNPFLTMFTCPIYPYYAHNTDGSVVKEDGKKQWNRASYLSGNNIAYQMRLDRADYDATLLDGNIYGTIYIPYDFELTVRGSLHSDKTWSTQYMNNIIGDAQGIGLLSEGFDKLRNYTFMQMLNWGHDYGLHHVDALLDHENYAYKFTSSSVSAQGQVFPDVYALGNFNVTRPASEGISEYRTESYLGRARYNYDNRYFGEASIRRDGTSRFAKNNRWGTFWSIGGSWIISSEKFMENVNWVDYLKLRAAYGSVGNDAAASVYAAYSLYGMASYDNEKALIPVSLAADDIHWEATKTLDVALEGNLWNRLNFSVGFFDKINSDLLFNVTKPMSAGTLSNTGSVPSVLTNIGTMHNYGFELAFKVDLMRTKDFWWDFQIDATIMKNSITKLPSGHSEPTQGLFYHKGIDQLYMTKWAGVDQLTGNSLYEMTPNSPDYTRWDENGNAYQDMSEWEQDLADAKAAGAFVEIKGKPYSTQVQYARRQLCGSALPKVYGSFGTNASWKGLTLNLLFTYGLGGWIYDSNYATLMTTNMTSPSALHKDVLKSWTEAPAGMTADSPNRIDKDGIPANNAYTSQFNNAESTRFLTTKSYLVLKNINLSYDLPKKWTDAMKMQGINVGVSIDNLFTVSARKGMNPQYGFGATQGASFVPARVFSFQLNARF